MLSHRKKGKNNEQKPIYNSKHKTQKRATTSNGLSRKQQDRALLRDGENAGGPVKGHRNAQSPALDDMQAQVDVPDATTADTKDVDKVPARGGHRVFIEEDNGKVLDHEGPKRQIRPIDPEARQLICRTFVSESGCSNAPAMVGVVAP